MTETTTIQITKDTKDLLDTHKQNQETYNEVVRRLAGESPGEMWTEEELRSIARQEAKDMIREYGNGGRR